MTVRINKPALNLREELAALRNQNIYTEQQFWFDNLVENGTDWSGASGTTPPTGWATTSTTVQYSTSSGQLTIDRNGEATGIDLSQTIFTVEGRTYAFQFDIISTTGSVRFDVTGITPFSTNTLGVSTYNFVATNASTYIGIRNTGTTGVSVIDNVSVYETDGTDIIHRLPNGWTPKDVFEDGLLQREGAAHDYTVHKDGFGYYVKPSVASGASTEICVIGVK